MSPRTIAHLTTAIVLLPLVGIAILLCIPDGWLEDLERWSNERRRRIQRRLAELEREEREEREKARR